MYQIQLDIEVGAPAARVWRALCTPSEVVRWDSGVTKALDAPKDYPRPGQHVRWRYRSRLWPVLHDRPQEVIPERRLRALLALGPYSFDETYELSETPAGCKISLELALSMGLPFLGDFIEHFWIGPDTERGSQASLERLKSFCEQPDSS